MPAKNSQPLNESKFNAVLRALKRTPRDVDGVAAKHNLKPSTVRRIRQSRTWAEYERRKAANLARQKTSKQGVVASQAKKAVRKPVSKRGVVIKDAPAPVFVTPDQLRKEVRAAVELLTLNFEDRLGRIEAKAENALDGVTEFRADGIRDAIQQARKERKPFWRFW